MNRKTGNATVSLISSILLLLAMSCAKQGAVGTWSGKTSDGTELAITLREDGSCRGVEDGRTTDGTWTQQGTSVTLTFDGEDLQGSMVSSDEMLLTEEKPNRTITLRRN